MDNKKYHETKVRDSRKTPPALQCQTMMDNDLEGPALQSTHYLNYYWDWIYKRSSLKTQDTIGYKKLNPLSALNGIGL